MPQKRKPHPMYTLAKSRGARKVMLMLTPSEAFKARKRYVNWKKKGK